MHHLILVREVDQQMSSSGCCGRLSGDAVLWDRGGCVFPERRAQMERFGEIYRAVRHRFGDTVAITMLDPRNFVTYTPLVIRDGIRNKLPLSAIFRAVVRRSLTMGILDGEILFSDRIPSPDEALGLIEARLRVHRVGAG